MKKLLPSCLLLSLVWAMNAFASIESIEEYYERTHFTVNLQDTFTCATIGALEEAPANKQCDVITHGNHTCYANCHCPMGYVKSCQGSGEVGVGNSCDNKYESCKCSDEFIACEGVMEGSGEDCTADGGHKYTSCTCPASYTKSCDGPGEVGVGQACDGKYTACTCNSRWVSCANDAGDGEACTADGGKKFDYCLVGGANSLCRAVTDATPLYDSTEYMLHANAFRGIENTKALIAAHGDAAVAAQLATNYYPHNRTDKNCAVSEGNRYFGKGKWYLPAAGEALYLAGTDFSNMSDIEDHSGINGETFTAVNSALSDLYSKSNQHQKYGKNIANNEGGNVIYGSPTFWTSSEGWGGYPYIFVNKGWLNKVQPGVHLAREKYYYSSKDIRNLYNHTKHAVYPVLMLEHCFDDVDIAIGDVLYSDMSTKPMSNYSKEYADNCSHFPLGVIYWISPDKSLVRVLSSYDVTFVPSNDPTKQNLIDTDSSSYDENQYNVADIPDDVWGCSTISPDVPSCTNTPRERVALTSTPCDGSSEYLAYANAFRGHEYTDAIVAQHGSDAVAAYAASQFYSAGVSENDPFFGKGKWYLPAAGEALYLAGVNFNAMSGITDTSGVNGVVFEAIENQLADIQAANNDKYSAASAFVTAAEDNYYAAPGAVTPRIWTSSEASANEAYYWDATTKTVAIADKQNPEQTIAVRPVMMLKDAAFVGNDPQVGDIVYNHLYTTGNYDYIGFRPFVTFASATIRPIGVIYWVSQNKRLVRIVSLSAIDIASGTYNSSTHKPARAAAKWLKTGISPVDIAGIPNDPWGFLDDYTKNKVSAMFDGRANTKAIVDQLGHFASAAYATTQFYAPGVAANDENFGQGKWYLPAIGEWVDAMGGGTVKYYKRDENLQQVEISREEFAQSYGKDYVFMDADGNESFVDRADVAGVIEEYGMELYEMYYGFDDEGNQVFLAPAVTADFSVGQEDAIVLSDTFNFLRERGVTSYGDGVASTNLVYYDYFMSSTDSGYYNYLLFDKGHIMSYYKIDGVRVRAFNLLENKFSANATKPQVGDVMYSDLSYGKTADYDSSKTVVGVVVWVSDDGGSAKIVNLNNLVFKYERDGKFHYKFFDPEHPYFDDDYNDFSEDSEFMSGSTDITDVADIGYFDVGYWYDVSKNLPSQAVCQVDPGDIVEIPNQSCDNNIANTQISVESDGRANTKAIVDQLGEQGLAAYATTQFYAPGVAANDENFGQGKWYLPAIGELMNAFGEYEVKYYRGIPTIYGEANSNSTEVTFAEYAQLHNNSYIKYEYNYSTGDNTSTTIDGAEFNQWLNEHQDAFPGSSGQFLCFMGHNEHPKDTQIYENFFSTIHSVNTNSLQIINDALTLLQNQGVATILNDTPWSSSEIGYTFDTYPPMYAYSISYRNGDLISSYTKDNSNIIRPFNLLKNKFCANAIKPQVGDVMYSNLSYGKAADYDSSKTAVGVVTWVSDDGASARIINLKDLTFSSTDTVNNFDPAHPYSGSENTTGWTIEDMMEEDISGVKNIPIMEFGYLYETSD